MPYTLIGFLYNFNTVVFSPNVVFYILAHMRFWKSILLSKVQTLKREVWRQASTPLNSLGGRPKQKGQDF